MYTTKNFELPLNLQRILQKSIFLEWVTIVYLISVIILMFLVMGSSQAMKTAWLEDALSIVPSIAFLISTKIYNKKPSRKFPYGYHRVFSIAFLTGALALFGMGLFLIIDSSISLFSGEHPTIGSNLLFGHQVWQGWIMILSLFYSAIPAMILGYKKLPLAKKLHNKILFTDADTQKADYMTAGAAMFGVLGIGFGFWWADAVTAMVISLSVIKDGFKNLKNAIEDLMDRIPQTVEKEEEDPLIEKMEEFIGKWEWVQNFEVRFREHGQVYFGEIKVVPNQVTSEDQIEGGVEALKNHHWKIHDVTIMLVENLNPK